MGYVGGAHDLKDEEVVRILLRLKPAMKRLVIMKSLLPHLEKWQILLESEEEHLKSSIYEPSEQVRKKHVIFFSDVGV